MTSNALLKTHLLLTNADSDLSECAIAHLRFMTCFRQQMATAASNFHRIYTEKGALLPKKILCAAAANNKKAAIAQRISDSALQCHICLNDFFTTTQTVLPLDFPF